MIAVDTNILVYAHRPDLPFHSAAARCLTGLAEGPSVWGIPWSCVHEFLSVVTNPRAFRIPTPAAQALAFLGGLRDSGRCVLLAAPAGSRVTMGLDPGIRTGVKVAVIDGTGKLLEPATVYPFQPRNDLRGAQAHDARIAAVCLSHGVREFWSADRDFSRYPALRVRNPLG